MMNLWREYVHATALVVVFFGGMGGAAAAQTPLATPSPTSFGAVSCSAAGVVAAVGRPPSTRPVLAASSQLSAKRVAQVTRNEKADVTFEVRPSANGGVEITGRSGQLFVKKTVQSTGEFVLELSTSGDRVTIAVNAQGSTVTRGKTTIEQRRSAAVPEAAAGVRRLLADSDAVLHFRAVAVWLLEAEDRSPAALAFIMADAVVGLMTGDVGAPRRAARFLAQPGLAKLRQAGMAVDCFTLMEERMVEAWTDYNACWLSVYPYDFFQELCAVRWVVQVESYWFSFLSCSGFNW